MPIANSLPNPNPNTLRYLLIAKAAKEIGAEKPTNKEIQLDK